MKEVGPWYTASGLPKGKPDKYANEGENGAENTTELMYCLGSVSRRQIDLQRTDPAL